MFEGVLGSSILKRAAEAVHHPADRTQVRPPLVHYHLTNIRDFSRNKNGKVDQPPYGGGPGLVMQCQPIWDAVVAAEAANPSHAATRIVMTPKGRTLTQKFAAELATKPRLLILAGHYEGIDQRVLDALDPIVPVSIGDYVVTGGELPAMVLIDAIVRLIPGVLGNHASTEIESFSEGSAGLLDYPHYTRPADWQGRHVPSVLLSGDHAVIEAWRRKQAALCTSQHRPDLMSLLEQSGEPKGGTESGDSSTLI